MDRRCGRILEIALPCILSIICSLLAFFKLLCVSTIPNDASFHFNIIMVNALFGGFLYTNYSLLLGLADNAIVKKLQGSNIIQKRNSHILKGILYSVISIIAGLYMALDSNHIGNNFAGYFNILVVNLEIVFMIFQIVYFGLSLFEMHKLIKNINEPVYTISDQAMKEIKEKIKGQRPRQQ